jgi:cysteine desulfurase
LWVRRGADLAPVLAGGQQERGRRPGSPDLLACVGFGAACAAVARRIDAQPRIATLRVRWQDAVVALGGVINAVDAPRVATVVSASFRGRRGDDLVAALDLEGVCVSSGAACSSGLSEPSAVLRAMYPDAAWRAVAAMRSSFGPETTETELESAIDAARRVFARGGPRNLDPVPG